jgi:hypothetical protein
MNYEQVPPSRPEPKIWLGLDSLEVGEEARRESMDGQNTEREDANMDESAVSHGALSSHFFVTQIFDGLFKGIAASGFLVPRGSSRRQIGNRSHPGRVRI